MLRCLSSWIFALLLPAGCGYTLVGYESPPGEPRSIAIETLRNDSYEAGVEYMVSDALRREILRRGAFELRDTPEGADLVLSGAVLPIDVERSAFSTVLLTLEYEITLALELQAQRPDGTELAIDGRSLRETERYLASADVEATRKNRQEAVRRLASVLAGRVHDALYEVRAP